MGRKRGFNVSASDERGDDHDDDDDDDVGVDNDGGGDDDALSAIKARHRECPALGCIASSGRSRGPV